MRRFYLAYQKWQTVSAKLSWSHYIVLLGVSDDIARKFYEKQVIHENWSKRELERQIDSSLFERLALSRDKKGVMLLSEKGYITNHPTEVIKDPYVLDFLRIPQSNKVTEKNLEQKIIDNLQLFLLELGKGFAFLERQKRMIIDGDDFYLDLLFYNRNLKRLVAIELKIGKFEAAHKGQMELYLKWLNKYEKQEGEKEPIGLILCAESNKEQVELLEMYKDKKMVAEYLTVMPSKKELEDKLHQMLIDAKERIERNQRIN
jgi:predicted nuclease of restriction endonuclease-like (RecB) superfamily